MRLCTLPPRPPRHTLIQGRTVTEGAAAICRPGTCERAQPCWPRFLRVHTRRPQRSPRDALFPTTPLGFDGRVLLQPLRRSRRTFPRKSRLWCTLLGFPFLWSPCWQLLLSFCHLGSSRRTGEGAPWAEPQQEEELWGRKAHGWGWRGAAAAGGPLRVHTRASDAPSRGKPVTLRSPTRRRPAWGTPRPSCLLNCWVWSKLVSHFY